MLNANSTRSLHFIKQNRRDLNAFFVLFVFDFIQKKKHIQSTL